MSRPRSSLPFAMLLGMFLAIAVAAPAVAAPPPVLLGEADPFVVLGGSTITNTGNTVLTGELGLHPGTSVTGFPPGIITGAQHINDAVAAQAKQALVTAYQDAAGRALTATLPPDIGGRTLVAGVYRTGTVPSLGLTGNVNLNAQGDPSAVFIFQIQSTLITATDSRVTLLNGAQACNVFWQVGSSATLGTRTRLSGNVMALSSISVNDSVVVGGRLLARNGAVTMINDAITRTPCAIATAPPPGGPTPDVTGPGVTVGGPPGILGPPDNGPPASAGPPGADCVTRNFTLRIRVRDTAGIQSISVYIDGRRVKRTAAPRSNVIVRVRGLRVGRHRVKVVAFDRAGNRSITRRSFARCVLGAAAPTFTG